MSEITALWPADQFIGQIQGMFPQNPIHHVFVSAPAGETGTEETLRMVIFFQDGTSHQEEQVKVRW